MSHHAMAAVNRECAWKYGTIAHHARPWVLDLNLLRAMHAHACGLHPFLHIHMPVSRAMAGGALPLDLFLGEPKFSGTASKLDL